MTIMKDKVVSLQRKYESPSSRKDKEDPLIV